MTNRATSRADGLHPALREVVDYLGGDITEVLDPHWVIFDIDDGYAEANIKEGSETIRLRANLLDDGHASAEELSQWLALQPDVVGGVLQAASDEDEEGKIYFPRIVFELAIGAGTTLSGIWRNHPGEIARFGEAWRNRATASTLSNDPMLRHGYVGGGGGPIRPLIATPQNAWLLIGDETSLLAPETLNELEREGMAQIFNALWTAPRNIEVGDLVLIYYVSPIKEVRFVARAASRAFWRSDIEVGGDLAGDKQWWAYLTSPVEIEPIPFEVLKAAQDGHLILKGRSGHFLRPETISALTFSAKDASRQKEIDRVVVTPTGWANLPPKGEITFDQWQNVASGALPLEAGVSDYIVEPMLRWAIDQRPDLSYRREYKVPSGSVDFVLVSTADEQPRVAIEVKRAIPTPRTGRWGDSPEFRQLRRYMDDLDTPGLLVDSHSVLLVGRGADAPFREYRRANVPADHLMAMLRHFPAGLTHWDDPPVPGPIAIRRARRRNQRDPEP